MRQARVAEREDEYLPDVSLAGLEEMHRRELPSPGTYCRRTY